MNKQKMAACLAGMVFAASLLAMGNENKIMKIGHFVDSGYLFYDGKYIAPPYEFTRNEFSVFVNGHKIYFPEMILKHLLRNRDSNVNISSIPKNISFDDFLNPEKPWAAYVEKEVENIRKNENNNQEKIIEIYRKLPFVKKVILHPIDGIIIETFKGDKTILDTKPLYTNSRPQPKRYPTKSDVKRFIEKECADKIQKEMEKGCCVFIFSDTFEKWILSPDEVRNNLPEIIDVLNSADSDNVKINKLYRLRVFPKRKNERAKMLVENYKSNDQLSCRIADILAERKTANFKRVKIEDKPTKEELIAVKKRAFENARKEWQKNHPKEYKREQKNRKLYLEKMQYLSKKGKKYWDNHKEELEKEIDEIKKLKSQMQKSF